MIYEIRRIKIFPLAKFMAILWALFCLIPMFFGIVTFIFESYYYRDFFNIFLFILFPIGGAIAGYIYGIILGAIYNLISDYFGGIEMEIEVSEKERQ
ncbi:MAG: hypothetical protein GWO87_00835 [Xanthomonadaceae bacterium]|nr:hypothetical protein [Rhodospirillaceae bacterium]NIA17719.1 hypothetical protein [Xanthomonadaceae bacterium]